MASYICKCGRVVEKSTTADNTGNRDTAGCEGCPYLLSWGPDRYVQGQGFVKDIQGYECRMSPSISYASTYYGRADDKTTLRIVSLDLDFLEEIQAWMDGHAEGLLSGGFSRDTIRGTDYSQAGRYSWSISCAQNKKGMAAKAALIQKFFRPDKSRRGKTPEEEKAIVLAAIEEGKAAHQRKKENMRYTISENLENDCVYAYAAKEFWVYDKQACRWYTSGFCREQYERAKQKLSRLTPEDFLADSNDYNLLDDYEIPSAALNALQEAVKSGKREVAPFEDTNPTDAAADASPCAPGASDALSLPSQNADADAGQGGGDDAANPTQAAPASPADAGVATASLCAAAPASLAAEPAPAFDFGADAETNMALMQDAQVFMAGSMARVMAAKRAHDRTANNYRGSWGKWCDLVGISRDTGDNMVRVAEQFGNIQINGQNLIDVQPLKLLYATSKASTPPEIRERVENLDITTHKQYQEAMAQLKSEREARKKAEHDAQRYREDSEKAREAAHTYHCQYEQASQQRNALLDQQTEYISRIEAAEKDKAAAQRRADVAEKERDGARQALRGTRKQEEKWREKAQTVQAQLDQLQAQPIPSTAIDMDELERRVAERMEAERAKHPPEDPERSQQDSRDAYDAFILATRSIDNIWKTLRPQVGRLGALQGNAKNMLLQQLMKVKEELIHECENRQSGS